MSKTKNRRSRRGSETDKCLELYYSKNLDSNSKNLKKKGQNKTICKFKENEEGTLTDGLKEGKVVFYDKLGNYFTGGWLNDKPHGMATKLFSNGNRYEGNYVDGKRSGLGRYSWLNGDEYFGNWDDGDMEGYGCFTWATGDIYKGQWRNNKMHGQGYKKNLDGSSIQGNFANSKANGICIKKYSSGDKYVGQYKNDMKEGYGEYVWYDGCIYFGEWRYDQMNGQGIKTVYLPKLTRKNSFSFSAQENNSDVEALGGFYDSSEMLIWNNNITISNEILSVQSQSSKPTQAKNQRNFNLKYHDVIIEYYGDLQHDKFYGWGVAIFGDGKVYSGDFLNGKFEGWGKLSNPLNGDIYEGEFSDGKKHGQGVIFCGAVYSDGQPNAFDDFASLESLLPLSLDSNEYISRIVHGNNLLESYQGAWSDDLPHGYGIKVYENRSVYIGYFFKGLRQGFGEYIDVNDQSIRCKGQWTNDKFMS